MKWVNGTTPLYRDCISIQEIGNTKVNTLITIDQQWDITKINQLFTPQSARKIHSMELLINGSTNDLHYWIEKISGEYTTYLLKQHQQEIKSMTPSFDTKFFRIIWSQNIMPRWKLFLWKLWNNNKATR